MDSFTRILSVRRSFLMDSFTRILSVCVSDGGEASGEVCKCVCVFTSVELVYSVYCIVDSASSNGYAHREHKDKRVNGPRKLKIR